MDHRVCQSVDKSHVRVETDIWLEQKRTFPQRLGTIKSFGSRSVYAIKLDMILVSCAARYAVSDCSYKQPVLLKTHSIEASETGILLLLRSSCNRWFSSVSRLSFSSAMDCFLLLPCSAPRISYGEDIVEAKCVKGSKWRD